MFLLDTNIVSELRRPRPHGGVLSWFRDVPAADLRLSAVTIGEVQAGIETTRERDPAKAAELEAWLDQVLATYDVLPVDAAAFREWARIMHGPSDTLLQDALIGAVATVNRLTVATRNVRDFERLGVDTVNPFAYPQE
ncbi:MAG: type II toxin-antitoxin system VapC family toxin [Gemmatimonadales bacterium]|nr:type II toxin-antitoxin system VapC family toxin [Gemmatimonadales bacterium]MYG48634.1 type II toxin-antitoxin system VapC family toxin [Gemmatimonadales bacterium]MYK01738.1 type II toxin-antitoxin system VapC family toxin [Candidatus Palauibacter ramosifaciens]